eukprot:gene265-biopygen1340
MGNCREFPDTSAGEAAGARRVLVVDLVDQDRVLVDGELLRPYRGGEVVARDVRGVQHLRAAHRGELPLVVAPDDAADPLARLRRGRVARVHALHPVADRGVHPLVPRHAPVARVLLAAAVGARLLAARVRVPAGVPRILDEDVAAPASHLVRVP